MARKGWERPEEHDHVLLLVQHDDAQRALLRAYLAAVAGPARARTLGRYPRFRLAIARGPDAALRRATAQVTVAAVDLQLPRRGGLEVVRALRARRPDLAILAFTAWAPEPEAVAALTAGADYFHEHRGVPDPEALERALDLAIDRRRLMRLIEKNEAEVEAARARLAQLGGGLAAFRTPAAREDVLPFKEAARRYLGASTHLFEGDSRGLARSLGVSYFALRRLLARYDVPLPSRSRKHGTGAS
jgi:CheY-like chemotaxis protein